MFSQFLMLAEQRTMAEPMGIRQLWILWASWFGTMLVCGVICWLESRRAERILAELDDED